MCRSSVHAWHKSLRINAEGINMCVSEVQVGRAVIVCDAEMKGNYWNVMALMGRYSAAFSQVMSLTFRGIKAEPVY